jgi:pimeloyl-ACP methyl ester carboxylesterase
MRECSIETKTAALNAFIDIPRTAQGIVIFAHGSGSSRFSSRNQFVARALNEAALATLLLDLLTPQEDAYDQRTAALRFDVELLATRVAGAIDWCRANDATKQTDVGLFGASTGAAAAIVAAAERHDRVKAVVSRGGRPDLAGAALREVTAPVLLIVGGNDPDVFELNRSAAKQLRAPHELVVIPRAGHLFEEPGTLERVAELSRDWFLKHL